MAETDIQVRENTRRIDGLASSLDRVKEDVGGLKSQIGEARGIALSADRGYHVLAERVEGLHTAQNKIGRQVDKIAQDTSDIHIGVARLDSVIKTGFKILGAVSALAGLFTAIYKIMGG